ncbi:tail fiber protein [Sphingopyxis sp. 113P3]|uniref:tail fiber protein n=1 Tax=Sphingopyxis sp. (strain 113P3) TaxID=292913 RepID=UPI0006AD578C|nr:tail fiber protein [Sphingopyxis sp. 113P3]
MVIPIAGDFGDNYLPLAGQHVSASEYPELFQVVGNRYCPPIIRDEVPAGMIERIRRWVGLTPRKKYVERDNPDYRRGFFRLPDMRAQS